MCGDYGFRSGFGRLYQGGDGEIPAAAWELVRKVVEEEERGRGVRDFFSIFFVSVPRTPKKSHILFFPFFPFFVFLPSKLTTLSLFLFLFALIKLNISA